MQVLRLAQFLFFLSFSLTLRAQECGNATALPVESITKFAYAYYDNVTYYSLTSPPTGPEGFSLDVCFFFLFFSFFLFLFL